MKKFKRNIFTFALSLLMCFTSAFSVFSMPRDIETIYLRYELSVNSVKEVDLTNSSKLNIYMPNNTIGLVEVTVSIQNDNTGKTVDYTFDNRNSSTKIIDISEFKGSNYIFFNIKNLNNIPSNLFIKYSID